MGSSGKIQQMVKLPGSKYLCITDETAGWFGTRDRGAQRMAHVISPFGKNVWDIKVGRDSNGSFLGDGWPQFVATHGIKVGWYLVFKHVGHGMVTLKVFDDSFVIKPFSLTITVLSPAEIESAFARKPQFIVPLQRSFKEKMPIPPEFLRQGYIPEEKLNIPEPQATFLTRWHIDLEKDGPNVFFVGSVWPEFLDNFDMSETRVLLIKYHGGCMNFSLETFGHGNNEHIEEETSSSQQSEQSPGAQGQEEEQISRAQGQEEEHISTPKTPKKKRTNGERMLESPTTSGHLNKRKQCVYELGSAGSQAWLRKKISSDSALKKFPLPGCFGFVERCKIALKPMESDKSWEVEGVAYYPGTSNSMNRLVKGWPKFCKENGLKEGDICTFKVVDSTLWEVDIEHC